MLQCKTSKSPAFRILLELMYGFPYIDLFLVTHCIVNIDCHLMIFKKQNIFYYLKSKILIYCKVHAVRLFSDASLPFSLYIYLSLSHKHNDNAASLKNPSSWQTHTVMSQHLYFGEVLSCNLHFKINYTSTSL